MVTWVAWPMIDHGHFPNMDLWVFDFGESHGRWSDTRKSSLQMADGWQDPVLGQFTANTTRN